MLPCRGAESGGEAMESNRQPVKATPLNGAIGCRIMKTDRSRFAMQLAILAIVLSATGRADAKDRRAF